MNSLTFTPGMAVCRELVSLELIRGGAHPLINSNLLLLRRSLTSLRQCFAVVVSSVNDSSHLWFTYTSRPKLLRGSIVYIHVSSHRVPAESKMWEKNDTLTSLHNRLSYYRGWETTKREVVLADLFNEPDCRDLFIKIKKKKKRC